MRPALFCVITLTALSLAACGPDSASLPSAPDPLLAAGRESAVTGSAHVPSGTGLREFTFHATRKSDGTVRGSYKIAFTATGLYFVVSVTCMVVEGNTGWLAGIISETNWPVIQLGTVSYFYAIDNGEGGQAAADRVSSARINDAAGEDLRFCEERPLLLPSFDIQEGNVQVH
jgi:hypothetical protein